MTPETARVAETGQFAVCMRTVSRDPHAIRTISQIALNPIAEHSASVEC